jgi:hypothetical protein
VDQAEDVLDRAASGRPVYTFKVPASLVKSAGGVRALGLVELTAGEELMATKRAGGDHIRLAYELALECVRYLDGKRVSTGDGSAEAWWNTTHPKVRTLVMTAYGKLHQPGGEETDSFFASMEASIGYS